MSGGWGSVKLEEVLNPVWREERVDVAREYRLLGARWYAGGLFLKDIKLGQQIRADRLYRVRAGDFVYNRLFAWKGSFAVATEEDDGAYVSNEFPCFQVNEERVYSRFLFWFFSQESAWTRALGLSTGATPTSRNRLKETAFLKMFVPLPPLDVQQRIVARIEELAAQIEEARTLRHEAIEASESLLRSILTNDKQAKPTPMRELLKMRTPDVRVEANTTYDFAGVYCFGRGVFKSGRKSGLDFAYKRLTRVRTGEFVYPKLMAWEGALGVVPPECHGCVVSPEFPVFEVIEDRVLPEVLDVYFRTPSVWPEISRASTGTNVRRRRLNPQDFLAYEMPLPSLTTQMTLRAVYAEIRKLRGHQNETAAELDALMPSILYKALQGNFDY
jgi:type I restriction enzyme S subunit